jgi:integrase
MREQRGYLYRQGPYWCVRYLGHVKTENGVERKSLFHRLAKVSDWPRKEEVKKGPFREFMARINAQAETGRVVVTMTVAEFVEGIYLPYVDGAKTASTAHGYRGLWARYVKERLGSLKASEVRTFDCRTLLKDVAATRDLSRTTLQHLKGFLSGVFSYALNEGLIETNPVHETMLPEGKPPRETHAYDLAQISLLLNNLMGPARAAVAVAGFAGLRSGEMSGLDWTDIGEEINVSRSVWRGAVNERTKTEASRATVPVIAVLRGILEEYRGGKPTGRVFDCDLQKLGKLTIEPVAEALGLKWWGFHALRRGIATNLYSLGATDKIVQRVLRHAKASVTRERYIKSVPSDVNAAMETMNTAVKAALAIKPVVVH